MTCIGKRWKYIGQLQQGQRDKKTADFSKFYTIIEQVYLYHIKNYQRRYQLVLCCILATIL